MVPIKHGRYIMDLISKPQQALNNIIELSAALENPSEKKKAKSLLKNGKIFVAAKIDETWQFAPSRFAGYKNNTIKKHTEATTDKLVDGRLTERNFDKHFQLIDSQHSLYGTLNNAFLETCSAADITPSKQHKNHAIRRYRLYSQNFSELEFDKQNHSAKLTEESHINRIVQTTFNTVRNSGKKQKRIAKTKRTDLTKEELGLLVGELLSDQKWECALTGLKIVKNGDAQLFPSLDRKDSEGHYFKSNLQIVCKFVNAWKSNQTDAEFKRLLGLIKTA